VQKDGLPGWVRHKVRVIPALGAGEFEAATLREVPRDASAAGSLLCIGALRRNKNLQEAVVAAARAGRRLLLAGEAIEPEYLTELREVIRDSGGEVEVRAEFLSAGRFEALLRTADAVLLPYAAFLAQSGVLERALVIGTPVVCADLPSLREQAGDRRGVVFYPPGDLPAFVQILLQGLPQTARRHEAVEPDPRWKQCAEAVL
jgi:glycosyltransferase involved in cell wall biosynthesis